MEELPPSSQFWQDWLPILKATAGNLITWLFLALIFLAFLIYIQKKMKHWSTATQLKLRSIRSASRQPASSPAQVPAFRSSHGLNRI